MRIIGATTDKPPVGFELGNALCIEPGEKFFNLGHHFRANAITGQKEQIIGCHITLSRCWRSSSASGASG